MIPTHPLDQLPIPLILVLTAALMVLAIELGIRLGRYRQQLLDGKLPKDISLMVGATISLLAFVLVFQKGTADQRFEHRRQLVVAEANAVSTAFLRAGILDEPYRGDSRELLQEYVDLRLAAAEGEVAIGEAEAQSLEIQETLWAQGEELAHGSSPPDMLDIYLEALNHMFEVHTERLVEFNARLPYGSLIWLFVLATLTMGVIGYYVGLSGEHNLIAFVGLALAFAAVIALIIDLDRSTQGLFQVSQEAMIAVQTMMAGYLP